MKYLLAAFIIVFLLVAFWVIKKDKFDGDNTALLNHYKAKIPNDGKTHIILHHTKWCPACKETKPSWDSVKMGMQGRQDIKMYENDEDISTTPGVSRIPTLVKYKNGKIDIHRGERDPLSIKIWIEKHM